MKQAYPDWSLLAVSALAVVSFLFFYFADVHLQILTLPSVIVFVGT